MCDSEAFYDVTELIGVPEAEEVIDVIQMPEVKKMVGVKKSVVAMDVKSELVPFSFFLLVLELLHVQQLWQ